MWFRSSTSDLCTSNDHIIISDQLTTTTTTQDDHQLSTPHHTVDLNASVSPGCHLHAQTIGNLGAFCTAGFVQTFLLYFRDAVGETATFPVHW